jgi:hypothetical protein
MVKRHTKSKAFQDVAIRAKPFFTERDGGVCRVAGSTVSKDASAPRECKSTMTLAKGSTLRRSGQIDQNGLAVADETPCGSKAQFLLVIREEPGAKLLRRHEQRRCGAGEEIGARRAFPRRRED